MFDQLFELSNTFYSQGRISEIQGDHKAACRLYALAYDRFPGHPYAAGSLVNSLALQNDWGGAVIMAEYLLPYQRYNPLFKKSCIAFLKQVKPSPRTLSFYKALEESGAASHDNSFLNDYGYALLACGRLTEAEDKFRRAIKAEPHIQHYTGLINIFTERGIFAANEKGVRKELHEKADSPLSLTARHLVLGNFYKEWALSPLSTEEECKDYILAAHFHADKAADHAMPRAEKGTERAREWEMAYQLQEDIERIEWGFEAFESAENEDFKPPGEDFEPYKTWEPEP